MTQDYSSKCRGWDLCIETGGEQGEKPEGGSVPGGLHWVRAVGAEREDCKGAHAPDLQNPEHDTSLGQTASKTLG